jgi:hypothetical protein
MEAIQTMDIGRPISSEALILRVYEEGFYKVAVHVSRKGGTLDDAKDVFHDAIVILYNDLLNGKAIESEVGYLYGIARHLWAHRLKESLVIGDFNDEIDSSFHTEPTINQKKLLAFLQKAGSRCMDLLVSFYNERLNTKNLVHKFGFSNEHSASVQKYKCIEKLREAIRDKSISYEDFVE